MVFPHVISRRESVGRDISEEVYCMVLNKSHALKYVASKRRSREQME